MTSHLHTFGGSMRYLREEFACSQERQGILYGKLRFKMEILVYVILER